MRDAVRASRLKSHADPADAAMAQTTIRAPYPIELGGGGPKSVSQTSLAVRNPTTTPVLCSHSARKNRAAPPGILALVRGKTASRTADVSGGAAAAIAA
jgi:hypothetical protein